MNAVDAKAGRRECVSISIYIVLLLCMHDLLSLRRSRDAFVVFIFFAGTVFFVGDIRAVQALSLFLVGFPQPYECSRHVFHKVVLK